jgi:predicted MPP superfamily phosphohydrolase
VVLTGDFVSIPLVKSDGKQQRRAEEAGPCADLLAGLRPRLGISAVLGNHDHSTDPEIVARHLERKGITVLRNQAVPVETQGARFWLAGIDDVLAQKDDLPRALAPVPRDEAVIALVHEPDFADTVAQFPVDLQFSGHSHAGQIRIPILGAITLPEMGQKYPSGLRRVRQMQLYTNRGIGNTGLPLRFDCPPEISVLTLRSGMG